MKQSHYLALASLTILLTFSTGNLGAVDLQSFEFNDANGTQLTAAANTANPGNLWFYEEDATTPGDETTGDTSSVQSGNYRVITDSTFATGLESRYLDIANVSSGTVYLEVDFANWSFGAYDNTNTEQIRFAFLDNDTGIDGATVTAQVQIRRDATSGSMELVGDSIGTAGSFDIANQLDLPDTQSGPFKVVLSLDKTSNSFEVFYQDGSDAPQVLGLGGVSRVRNGNSLRWVTNNFGADNFLPFVINEEVNVDRIALSDTNPFDGELLTLEVNRDTGAINLINTTGSAVSGVTSITIESATGSIDPAELADFSGTLSVGQNVSLDSMPGTVEGAWLQSPVEDLRAELATSGGVRTIDVNFVGNGGIKWESGDLDFDGAIDADDYAILAANAESDLSALSATAAYQLGDLDGSGTNDVIDFGIFKDAFIAENSAAAFAQLIAGVPEPSSALIAMLGAAAMGFRRRRRVHLHSFANDSTLLEISTMKRHPGIQKQIPLATLAVAALLALTASPVQAVIFEEFLFDDPAGTLYTEVANNINPGTLWDEDTDTIDVTTNGLGQLDGSLKANTGFGTNYIDIDPAYTTGTIYGVMELTWDFQSVLDTSENEEVRISFTNNDPRGTEITAEWRITRTDDDELVMNGVSVGTGSSGTLSGVTLNGGSLTQTNKFIGVLQANLDTDAYEVLFSNDGGSSFQSAGTGVMSPDRVIEAVRLTLNNDLSGDNVLIDRFYLTDELPFVGEIDTLTLRIDENTGAASIVNDTGTDFDIDYYKISSGDDSLIEVNWNSLQQQSYDAVDGPDVGSTAGDGIGETWTEAGGSDDGVLSESFLIGSSVITSSTSPLGLGNVINLSGDAEQLEFEYRDAISGTVFSGNIEFVAGIAGDYNGNGVVDAADYTVWRDGLGTTFTAADYLVWKNNFGATSGTGSASAGSVPEPASLSLLLLAIAAQRRRASLRREAMG